MRFLQGIFKNTAFLLNHHFENKTKNNPDKKKAFGENWKQITKPYDAKLQLSKAKFPQPRKKFCKKSEKKLPNTI